MFRKLIVAVGAIALTALVPAVASAAVYDLNADWSETTNPNGVWNVRQGGSSLPLVADWYGFGPAWAPGTAAGAFLPVFFKADTDQTGACSPGTCDWRTGDVVVHTTDIFNGNGSGIANVLFTAPFAGVADISGVTWAARYGGGRTQAWDLLVNGSSQASGVLPGDGTNSRGAPDTFALSNLSLAAGDQVELRLFQTGANPNGDFVGINLHVDLNPVVSGVPGPATWTILLMGLGGAGAVLRRRRSAAAA